MTESQNIQWFGRGIFGCCLERRRGSWIQEMLTVVHLDNNRDETQTERPDPRGHVRRGQCSVEHQHLGARASRSPGLS
jgi:hypothetical protein